MTIRSNSNDHSDSLHRLLNMSALTDTRPSHMTDLGSSQPVVLNATAKVVFEVLSVHLSQRGVDHSSQKEIIALDRYTFCGGQREAFRKIFAPSTIHDKHTEESIPENAAVDELFNKAEERMRSTPIPDYKQSLFAALSVGAHAAPPSAESFRVKGQEDVEGDWTRRVVLTAGQESEQSEFPFWLPEDLEPKIYRAYNS